MLDFIIPLKSRAVSKDWETVERLCERSVRSVLGQTSDEFRLILVCTDRPDIDLTHPSITVVQNDFPIPDSRPESRMHDKGLKVRRGLVEAGNLGGGAHVMIVDADDCIHRQLAEWVEKHDICQSWVIDQGYWYEEGSRTIRLIKDFDQICGTSFVARLESDDFPADMEAPRGTYFDYLIDGHVKATDYLRKHGRPVASLPFPGSIYVKETGENYTGKKGPGFQYLGLRTHLRQLVQIRPLTPAIRSNFGLYQLAADHHRKSAHLEPERRS
jgi:hypothetical protein